MTETAPTAERRTGFWLTITLLMVFVAYPLSYGPAIWIVLNFDVPKRLTYAFGVVYIPLMWLHELVPGVRVMLDWYVNFWADL